MRLRQLLFFTMTALILLRSGFAFLKFQPLRARSWTNVNVLHRKLVTSRYLAAKVDATPLASNTVASPVRPSSRRKKAPGATKVGPTISKTNMTALDPKLMNHPILSILNEDQIRAATSFVDLSYTREDFIKFMETPLAPRVTMVLAGAGSGKTRVLVHRIAYLLKELHVNPDAILATTFTNKAAREIKERIHALMYPEGTPATDTLSMAELLEGEESSRLPQWLGTFHSLCYKILLYNAKQADVENCNMIDEAQQKTIVKKIMSKWEKRMDDLKLDHDVALKKCLTVINRHKDNGRRASAASARLSAVVRKSEGDEDWFYQSIYESYEQHCQEEKLIDFNEVLLRTYELFVHHPEVLQRYRRQFQYIHVDEFQDTNGVQYGIVRLLVDGPAHPKTGPEPQKIHHQAGPSLFVVGDDDQAIYGFRGAKADIMQQVGRDYPGCALIKLEQNYRSTHTILRAANSVINMNKIRLGKSLWTGKESHLDEKVHVFKADNEFKEAEYVASEILKRTSNGPDGVRRKHIHMRAKENEKRDFSLSDVAILVRKRVQIMPLERALLQSRIPYRIRGGHNFYQRDEVQQVLMYLKLIENRHNNVAFQKVVNFPPRGVTTKLLAEVEEYAATEGVSLWDAAVAVTQRAFDPSTPVDGGGLESAESGAESDSDSDVDNSKSTTDAATNAKASAKVKKPKKVKAKPVSKTVLQLADFLRTVDQMHALTDRIPVDEAVKVAIVQSGVYGHYITASLKPTKQSAIHARRVEHLAEFAALVDLRGGASVFEDHDWIVRYNGTLDAADLDSIRARSVKRDALDRTPMQVFLDETAFDEDHTDKISNTSAHRAVQIFTIHGVKGLEFPVVFLCGAEEGILPFANTRNGTVAAQLARLSIQKSLALEEEDSPFANDDDVKRGSATNTTSSADKAVEESRRLFYVALTRAREVLYITHAATRQQDGLPRKTRRSMFLDELDEDVIANAKL